MGGGAEPEQGGAPEHIHFGPQLLPLQLGQQLLVLLAINGQELRGHSSDHAGSSAPPRLQQGQLPKGLPGVQGAHHLHRVLAGHLDGDTPCIMHAASKREAVAHSVRASECGQYRVA